MFNHALRWNTTGLFAMRCGTQLAAAGDQTRDPSQPWPDNREVADLGVLTLDKSVVDSLEAEKKLAFLPTHLTDGIKLSDDRLLVIRAGPKRYRSRGAAEPAKTKTIVRA